MTSLTPNLGLIKPGNTDIARFLGVDDPIPTDDQWYHKNNLILDGIADSPGKVWIPHLHGEGSDPALGTSGAVRSGRYRIFAGVVFFEIVWRFGNTGASFGSGVYFFELPTEVLVPPHLGSATGGAGDIVGEAYMRDESSPSNSDFGKLSLRSGANRQIRILSGTIGSAVSPTAPFTWAAQDAIACSGAYLYGGEIP